MTPLETGPAPAGTDDVPRSFINRRAALLLCTLGAMPLLQACDFIVVASSTIRYRMTVEIDTPEGVRSGSSVMEVTRKKHAALDGKGRIDQYYKGEAVAVDLPSGKTLFALLVDKPGLYDYTAFLLYRALTNGKVNPPLSRAYWVHEWLAQDAEARQVKPTILLAPADYPFLVRFGDIRVPKSVEAVDLQNLAQSFGPGFSLKRIYITINDEEPTGDMLRRIPWLGSNRYGNIFGDFRPKPNPKLWQLLSRTDFIRDGTR